MGLKKAESQVKTMLEDTILALCRNTLNYHSDISIEGIIGVTLDNEEIFLVNINQSFQNPQNSLGDGEELSQKKTAESEDEHSSHSSNEGSDPEESVEKKRRKRKRRRKSRHEVIDAVDGQSKYSHNDKENGCSAISDNEQNTSMNESQSNADQLDFSLTDIKQEAEDLRNKESRLVVTKDEMTDFLHVGTQFASLYNTFNSPGCQDLGSHGIPISNVSPTYSSITSPTPLSPSHNIPLVPGPSIRSPCVARKSSASPRRLPESPMKFSNCSPEKAICQLCGRVCVSRSKLVIHMRVHTGEKPFICFICGRGCVQKSDLKKHIRTVHKMFVQQ